MRLAALACLLVLTPGQAFKLRYRFEKGMTYVDTQQRVVKQVLTTGKTLKIHKVRETRLKRTILEVDETDHPTIERVEVLAFRDNVVEWPEQEMLGIKPRPCEGKTFVWRRMETRWGLFTRDDEGKTVEVTKTYTHLVEQLKNWRDARLPERAVRPGDAWEISAEEFLQTSGITPPKGAEGRAVFKLESMDGTRAKIPFEFRWHFRDKQARVDVEQKGVWTFDAARGRDVAFKMSGTIRFDKGKTGTGEISMIREVTYRSR